MVPCVGYPLVEHLEGSDHTSHVVGVDERRTLRVPLGKKRVQGLWSLLGGHPLVRLPDAPVLLAGRELHLVNHRVEIQARAPAENGDAPLAEQPVDAAARVMLKSLDRVVLVDVGHVNHEQRTATLRDGRLCRPDVHPTIDLHSIDGDDGAPQPCGQELGDRALTGRRGAYDADDAAATHRGSPSTLPRRYQVRASSTRTSAMLPTRSSARRPSGSGKCTVRFFSL